MKRKTTYIILILLFLIGIKQYIHFNDYEIGIVQGFFLVLSFTMFFIIFLVLLIKDIYGLIKFKKKFDFIPSILLIIFIISIWFGFSNVNEPFFWKKEFYKGKNCYINSNDKIFLYRNGTCAFKIYEIEHKSIVQGKFKIVNDTLKISDYDTTLVNNSFSNLYLFLKDSSLVSLDKHYQDIIKIK
jgi:hypothetical protein